MATVTNKELVTIGQRVKVRTQEGEFLATVAAFPFKTKNAISVIYDGDAKQSQVKLDLDVYGECITTLRGRRPASSYELPGAQTLVDAQAQAQAQQETAKPQRRRSAAVETVQPVQPATRGNGIQNAGSGKLMKIAGKTAYAFGLAPSEEKLAELLTVIDAGMRREFGLPAKRQPRQPAPVPAQPPQQQRRRNASPAPVPAPVTRPIGRRVAPPMS